MARPRRQAPEDEWWFFTLSTRQRAGLVVLGWTVSLVVSFYALGWWWPAVLLLSAGFGWTTFCFWPEIRRVRIVDHETPGESAGPLIFAGIAGLAIAAVGAARLTAPERPAPAPLLTELRHTPTSESSSTTVPESAVRISLRQRVQVFTDELDRFDHERKDSAPRADLTDLKSLARASEYDEETMRLFKQRFLKRLDDLVAEFRTYGVRDDGVDSFLKMPMPSSYDLVVYRLPRMVDKVP